MSSSPLISVVVCTYNGEKHLAEQLESILRQTYSNLEIVVCDDASTDNTATIIQSFAAADARIRFYQNKKNLGFNKNFEQALLFARGEWIAIADQDDIWLPQKIHHVAALISPGTLLIHSHNADFRNGNPAVTFFNPSRLRFEGSHTRQLLLYNTVTGHTVLLHKNLLQAAIPFPQAVYYDWWLGVIATLQGRVRLCREILVLHRQHGENASQKRFSARAFFRQHVEMLQSFLPISNLGEDDAALLKHLISLLQTETGKRFSFRIFFFFLRHAKSAFYYRKKSPMWFYYLKYSWQKATMDQKYWP